MNLILFGYKRCGKTLFGKMVAKKLNLPFLDTDALVEDLYFKEYHEKLSSRQIVQKNSEPFFRQLEKKAIASLQGVKNSVIALGGGAILDPENQKILAKAGQLVYLVTSKETLKKRLLSGELPTFFDPKSPESSFEKMYTERKPIYEKIPAQHIVTDGKSDEEVVSLLCKLKEEIDAQ